mmetsp:Transcript_131970/g.228714  ORF Transcript_131970/g.228714 Transcript_131970/m.228714 type:complete len:226 (-) Transcript_131970:28-705(-)
MCVLPLDFKYLVSFDDSNVKVRFVGSTNCLADFLAQLSMVCGITLNTYIPHVFDKDFNEFVRLDSYHQLFEAPKGKLFLVRCSSGDLRNSASAFVTSIEGYPECRASVTSPAQPLQHPGSNPPHMPNPSHDSSPGLNLTPSRMCDAMAPQPERYTSPLMAPSSTYHSFSYGPYAVPHHPPSHAPTYGFHGHHPHRNAHHPHPHVPPDVPTYVPVDAPPPRPAKQT